MSRNNRVCCVCGKEYYYCNNDCFDSRNQPSWKGSFHDENCRNIYNACASYNIGQMTHEEAKNILDGCDLSRKEHFTPATQRLIKEIYAVEAEIVEPEKETVKPVKVAEVEIAEPKKETKTSTKTNNKKKSNYKKLDDKFKKYNG